MNSPDFKALDVLSWETGLRKIVTGMQAIILKRASVNSHPLCCECCDICIIVLREKTPPNDLLKSGRIF